MSRIVERNETVMEKIVNTEEKLCQKWMFRNLQVPVPMIMNWESPSRRRTLREICGIVLVQYDTPVRDNEWGLNKTQDHRNPFVRGRCSLIFICRIHYHILCVHGDKKKYSRSLFQESNYEYCIYVYNRPLWLYVKNYNKLRLRYSSKISMSKYLCMDMRKQTFITFCHRRIVFAPKYLSFCRHMANSASVSRLLVMRWCAHMQWEQYCMIQVAEIDSHALVATMHAYTHDERG